MKVPKYVQEIMQRSSYEYDLCRNSEMFAVGYTISIKKATHYTHIHTFQKEIDRLCKWANRSAGVEVAYILYIPNLTHYQNQTAIVTIYDPVMKYVEKYISHT